MASKKQYSFYLFGQDSLAIACIEILLENHFIAKGIISVDNKIKEWALERGLPFFNNPDELINELELEVDYLFSVQNEFILKSDLLKSVRILPINYHNSPLPRYAGLNATSWAILNNEKEHGITWHIISEGIDTGDIIKQKTFILNDDETRASLDLKCTSVAKESFVELVNDIKQQHISFEKQDLSKRTYYSLNDKPMYDGVLNWMLPAEEIDRICRSLEFIENQANSFAIPKVYVGGNYFILKNYRILQEKSSPHVPGTIININDSYITLATATYNIAINEVLTIEGYSISLVVFLKLTKIEKGHTLLIDFSSLPRNKTNYKQERYWVNKIKALPPKNSLFLGENTPLSKNLGFYQLNITDIPFFKLKQLIDNRADLGHLSITLLCLYLFRLNNYENYYFHINSDIFEGDQNFTLFSKLLPFNTVFNHYENFIEAFNKISNELNQITKNITFKRDIFYRYPCLREKRTGSLIPELILNFKDGRDILYENAINLFIDPETGDLEFKLKNFTLNTELISLLENFKFVIADIVDKISNKPDIQIYQINIVSKQHWDIIEKHYKRSSNLQDTGLIGEFSKIVESFPDKIALKCDLQSITYKELELKAKAVANYLLSANIESGQIIAVFLEPGIEFIISVLAVIYSGNTYLPINTTYPSQFINGILSDSECKYIISTKSLAQQLSEVGISSKKIIDISDFKQSKVSREYKYSNNLAPAYVMYTSGSTGKPKGVIIEQRSIIRLVKNTNYIEILPNDNMLQASSVAFDASTFEIWGALLNGATLVILEKETLLNPLTFKKILLNDNITILWLTSALFDKFSQTIPEAFYKLKYLLTGGDVVSPYAIRQLQRNSLGAPQYILNGYGPTENTTFTTTYLIPNLEEGVTSIPIGKPISNTYVYILDKFINLLPIGAAGELFIGGEGLAKGYLNRPELTSEKFIHHKIHKNEERLYKTGDLVRWLSNGNIEFKGRRDHQVKIRGYRIELNAVKQYILSLADITDCFVDVQDNSKNNKYILAYIVTKDIYLNVEKIRQQLNKLIPDYMIPKVFIQVKEIPLNVNGKVDVAKLRLQNNKIILKNNYSTPITKNQKLLTKLWSKILNIENIGVDENFFDLGGNSLLIAELAVELRKLANYSLSIKEFLYNPTILHLDKLINDGKTFFVDELKEEIKNDTEINIPNIKSLNISQNSNNILLTGATGFLGSYILYDLLKQTDSIIYCVIRAKTYNEARYKILNSLQKYSLLSRLTIGNVDNRIKIIIGDLSKPALGISEDDTSQLSMVIDKIYHVGAEVHHILDYESLRKPNVLSTKYLINLAFTNKIKSIYYISTLSVAPVDSSGNYCEEIRVDLADIKTLLNGYEQTKWASELLLDKAYKSGLDVRILRPCWIMGDTLNGICPFENNHLLLLLKGCIQMGAAPAWQNKVNMYPVDLLSNAIVQISRSKETTDFIYNFSNPNSLTWLELINRLNTRGYNIKIVKEEIWLEQFFSIIDKSNAAYTIMPLYLSANKVNFNYDPESINYSNTKNAIKKINQQFPVIDHKVIDLYISYLENSHFLANLNFFFEAEEVI